MSWGITLRRLGVREEAGDVLLGHKVDLCGTALSDTGTAALLSIIVVLALSTSNKLAVAGDLDSLRE